MTGTEAQKTLGSGRVCTWTRLFESRPCTCERQNRTADFLPQTCFCPGVSGCCTTSCSTLKPGGRLLILPSSSLYCPILSPAPQIDLESIHLSPPPRATLFCLLQEPSASVSLLLSLLRGMISWFNSFFFPFLSFPFPPLLPFFRLRKKAEADDLPKLFLALGPFLLFLSKYF